MKKTRIFTLIELLIVITIVLILAGILLPALKKARDMSKRTDCSNNLKHIGTAVIMYAGDYNEWVVPQNYGAYISNWGWPEVLYHCNFIDKVLQCQLDNVKKYDPDSGWSFRGTTYGINYYLSGIMRFNLIAKPSQTYLVADCYGTNSCTIRPTAGFSWGTETSIKGRHNGFANILFADTHVESVRRSAIVPAYARPPW